MSVGDANLFLKRLLESGQASGSQQVVLLLQSQIGKHAHVADVFFHVLPLHHRTVQYFVALASIGMPSIVAPVHRTMYKERLQQVSTFVNIVEHAGTEPAHGAEEYESGGTEILSPLSPQWQEEVSMPPASPQQLVDASVILQYALADAYTFWLGELFLLVNRDVAKFEQGYTTVVRLALFALELPIAQRIALVLLFLMPRFLVQLLKERYSQHSSHDEARSFLQALIFDPLLNNDDTTRFLEQNHSNSEGKLGWALLQNWSFATASYLHVGTASNAAARVGLVLNGARVLFQPQLFIEAQLNSRVWNTPWQPSGTGAERDLSPAALAFQYSVVTASDLPLESYSLQFRLWAYLMRSLYTYAYNTRLPADVRQQVLRNALAKDNVFRLTVLLFTDTLDQRHEEYEANVRRFTTGNWFNTMDLSKAGKSDYELLASREIPLPLMQSANDLLGFLQSGAPPAWNILVSITLALLFDFADREQLFRYILSWIPPAEERARQIAEAPSASSSDDDDYSNARARALQSMARVAFDGYTAGAFLVPRGEKANPRSFLKVASPWSKSPTKRAAAAATSTAPPQTSDNEQGERAEALGSKESEAQALLQSEMQSPSSTSSAGATTAEITDPLDVNVHIVPGLLLTYDEFATSADHDAVDLGPNVHTHFAQMEDSWRAHVLVQAVPLFHYRGAYNIQHTNAHIRVITLFKHSLEVSEQEALSGGLRVPAWVHEGCMLTRNSMYFAKTFANPLPHNAVTRSMWQLNRQSPKSPEQLAQALIISADTALNNVPLPSIFYETIRQLQIMPPYLDATNSVVVNDGNYGLLIDQDAFYRALLAPSSGQVRVNCVASEVFPAESLMRAAKADSRFIRFGTSIARGKRRDLSLLYAVRPLLREIGAQPTIDGAQLLLFDLPCWHIEPLQLTAQQTERANFVLYLLPSATAITDKLGILLDGKSVRRLKQKQDPRDRLNSRLLPLGPPELRGGKSKFVDAKTRTLQIITNREHQETTASPMTAGGAPMALRTPSQAELENYTRLLQHVQAHADTTRHEPQRQLLSRAFATTDWGDGKYLVQQHYYEQEHNMHVLGFCGTARNVIEAFIRGERAMPPPASIHSPLGGELDYGQLWPHHYDAYFPCELPNAVARDCFITLESPAAQHQYPEMIEVTDPFSGAAKGPLIFERYLLGHGLMVYAAQHLGVDWTWIMFLSRERAHPVPVQQQSVHAAPDNQPLTPSLLLTTEELIVAAGSVRLNEVAHLHIPMSADHSLLAYAQMRYIFDVSWFLGVPLPTNTINHILSVYDPPSNIALEQATLSNDIAWVHTYFQNLPFTSPFPPWIVRAANASDLGEVVKYANELVRIADWQNLVTAGFVPTVLMPDQVRDVATNLQNLKDDDALFQPQKPPICCASLVELCVAAKFDALDVGTEVALLVQANFGIVDYRALRSIYPHFVNPFEAKLLFANPAATLERLMDGLIDATQACQQSLMKLHVDIFREPAFALQFTGDVLVHYFGEIKRILGICAAAHVIALRTAKTNLLRMLNNPNEPLENIYQGLDEAMQVGGQKLSLAFAYRSALVDDLIGRLQDLSSLRYTHDPRAMQLLNLIEGALVSRRISLARLEMDSQFNYADTFATPPAPTAKLFVENLTEEPPDFDVGALTAPYGRQPGAVTTMQIASSVDALRSAMYKWITNFLNAANEIQNPPSPASPLDLDLSLFND